jgi:hypothetical protein
MTRLPLTLPPSSLSIAEMTRLPLRTFLSPHAVAASPARALLLPARRLLSIPSAMPMEITAPTSGGYPSPVSPPYPAASKDVELRRAMTASACSAAFASADVVFEDEWLAVVDKPAGVYCEALLSALPCSADSGVNGKKKRLLSSETVPSAKSANFDQSPVFMLAI